MHMPQLFLASPRRRPQPRPSWPCSMIDGLRHRAAAPARAPGRRTGSRRRSRATSALPYASNFLPIDRRICRRRGLIACGSRVPKRTRSRKTAHVRAAAMPPQHGGGALRRCHRCGIESASGVRLPRSAAAMRDVRWHSSHSVPACQRRRSRCAVWLGCASIAAEPKHDRDSIQGGNANDRTHTPSRARRRRRGLRRDRADAARHLAGHRRGPARRQAEPGLVPLQGRQLRDHRRHRRRATPIRCPTPTSPTPRRRGQRGARGRPPWPRTRSSTPTRRSSSTPAPSSSPSTPASGSATFAQSKGALGQYHSNLAAAGIDRKQFDVVIISHFHGDHINGLLDAGQQAGVPERRNHGAGGRMEVLERTRATRARLPEVARRQMFANVQAACSTRSATR